MLDALLSSSPQKQEETQTKRSERLTNEKGERRRTSLDEDALAWHELALLLSLFDHSQRDSVWTEHVLSTPSLVPKR